MTQAGASDGEAGTGLARLEVDRPIWDQFFTVAPLVVVGTREPDGSDDLAPKHMAGPVGWQNYFGFVCTPRHATYRNIRRDRVFAVTFPKPGQWLETSLTAAPRCEDDSKPDLALVQSYRAREVDCPLVAGGYLTLECALERIVDGFGENSLIIGRILAAAVDLAYLRAEDGDDQDLIHAAPLLAYLSPGRFAEIRDSLAFPMPRGLKK